MSEELRERIDELAEMVRAIIKELSRDKMLDERLMDYAKAGKDDPCERNH